jgi:hypothetical protein
LLPAAPGERYTHSHGTHHPNFLDLHPKLLINTQIFWIVFGMDFLAKWLPRTVESWKASESYNLPQGIAYSVIGLVVVVANFILVNSAVSRL